MQHRKRSLSPTNDPPQMSKKTKSEDETDKVQAPQKKSPNSIYETPGIVATAQAAAAVDGDPPVYRLNDALKGHREAAAVAEDQQPGDAVVYWMRMEDIRIVDNRALESASRCAKKYNLPLLVLFAFSPGDYKAHDRSPRRIDWVLRNLRILKHQLTEMHIPLYTFSHGKRKEIPEEVIKLLETWRVKHLFVNIEYEVDELRRDLAVLKLASDKGIRCELFHDRCVVEPGLVRTKQNKVPTVYTPWLKQWTSIIQSHIEFLQEVAGPEANDPSIREHKLFSSLFEHQLPDFIPGFKCEDAEKMEELWPAGTEAGLEALDRFLSTKARKSQVGDKSLLEPGAKEADIDHARIGEYEGLRVRVDMDSTSRLSPYLAAGVICARQCIRHVMKHAGMKRFDATKGSGPGVWIQEVGWRDFYSHIMAAYPRVSMGRPFQEKYADVYWEEDVDGRVLQAWKEGKTGYPIVDAAMRQCQTQGYMHNRARMIAAMFLTKHLMLDWRLGERHFMQNFIDGDLSSNNGGWQWCASTGTDAQPYFRIFNPYLQSEKADPNGDYIKHFVPELRHLKGKALFDPYNNLPEVAFKKLGYPKPMVEHKAARDRAIRRFKNVGEA